MRDSYIKRNGALVQRSQYPTIVKFMQDNPTLVTTEANWPSNKNLYTWGDGGTTIRVPDDRDLYEQLSDALGILEAGLPNISGYLQNGPIGNQPISVSGGAKWSGAFRFDNARTLSGSAGTGPGTGYYDWYFDASYSNPIYARSDTVTPPSVRRIVQMKY